MKDEENLTAQEIKEEALLTIDGPDFHGCGREFRKELKWVLALFRFSVKRRRETTFQ